MKNDIITENINGMQFNELKETMQTMIEESIASLSYNGGYNDKKDYLSHLAWYKDCEMNDYFGGGFEEILDDEDGKIGEGLNTIAHKFVLNDDTKADFESAFEQARDEAFEARLKEIAEEIEEIEDDDIKDIDIDDTLSEEEQQRLREQDEYLEKAGDDAIITDTPSDFIASHVNEACEAVEKQCGVKVAHDNDDDYEFFFDLLQDIYDLGYNLSCRQIAAWAGANVCVRYQGSEYFDYDYTFYKVDKKS